MARPSTSSPLFLMDLRFRTHDVRDDNEKCGAWAKVNPAGEMPLASLGVNAALRTAL